MQRPAQLEAGRWALLSRRRTCWDGRVGPWEGLLMSSVLRERTVREGPDARKRSLQMQRQRSCLVTGEEERDREKERSRDIYAYCPRCVLRYCSILPFDRAWLSCREADRTSQQHHGSNAVLITVCRQQVCTKLLFASLFSTRLQNKGALCDMRTGYTKPVSIEMDLADFVLTLGLNRPLTTRRSQALPYMP